MKKTALCIMLTSLLFFSVILAFTGLACANPYSQIHWANGGEVNPRQDTQPPKIAVTSKEQNLTADPTGLSLGFIVEVGESKSADQQSLMIDSVYYKADWQENDSYIYKYSFDPKVPSETIAKFTYKLNLTGIPEGSRSLFIYANEKGRYYDPPMSEVPMWSINTTVTTYYFQITGVTHVSFNISKPLTITVSPITNQSATEIPLNFSTNKPASKIWYTLDKGTNTTILGNTTLAGLQPGLHNITVYSSNNEGAFASSQTVNFTVASANPPPALTAVVVFLVIVVAAVGGLVYHFRYKGNLLNR